MSPQLSVVIPVYNEAGNIGPLLQRLGGVLSRLGRSHEVIVVNDGSTDDTSAEIAAAARTLPECRELRLPHNVGQAEALLAGLSAAKADFMVTLDGDGQNDPEDLPALLQLVESGIVDLACGWRVRRHDTALRRIMSRAANAVRRVVLRDPVHDAGCQLRVFRREVCRSFEPMELMQSFIPALAAHAGFRVGERPVRHHPRARGRSKYGLGRLWLRPALAMLALRWRWWRQPRTSR